MIEKIIKRLCEANHQVFIVGGAVRDLFLDKKVADEDLVTSAKPDEIIELFSDLEVNLVGKTFGVVIVESIEVATFRSDTYTGHSGKAQIKYADSIEEDLSRRDLTINSLALCPISGDLVDIHEGRKDLKKRIIKFVGDPRDRINEDPVRIIRAARFKASIDGEFDFETLVALRELGYLVNYVAPERIRLEVLKALKNKYASRFFNALHEIGILRNVFPSLEKTIGFEGGDYHKETVFEHNMLAGDHISPRYPLLKLAAYLHDVGKPEAFKEGHFLEHEDIGADIVRKELEAMRFSNDEILCVTNIIKVHMNLISNLTPRASRRLLKRLADHGISFFDFLRMKMADRAGNLAKDNRPFSHLVALVRKFNNINIPDKVTQLALNGHDIQEILGISPGREVGKILNGLLEFVLENGEEFNTKEKLTELVKSRSLS